MISKIIILFILLVGLFAAVLIIKNPITFFSKASAAPIEIVNTDGSTLPQDNGVPVSNSTQVKLNLSVPNE